MNLEWYYTFIVLARVLNYRKASEELFITQPSIFQQIKKLEQYLNQTLFENINGSIYLTDAGKQFLPIAKDLTNTFEDCIDKIKNINSKYSSHLHIVVTPYIANYIIPKFLLVFFNQEPNIEISIVVKDSNVVQSVEDGTFDIGILREEPYNKKINCEQVCEGKIKLIVPNIEETLDKFDETYYLRNYKVLANNHPTYWNKTITSIYSLVPYADIISIEDVKICENLIKANQGVSYLPTYILNDDIDNSLRIIEPKQIESPISFTYLISVKKSKEIETFSTLFKSFITVEQNRNYSIK